MTWREQLRFAGRAAIGTAAALVCLAVLGAVVLAATGHRPVVIQTGSMGDSAPPGSLIVARSDADIEVGEVLVMRTEGRATVTHRVVDIETRPEGAVAVTRGDANPDIDPAPYSLADEELTARWVIPGAGRWLLAIRSPFIGLSLLILIVATVSFVVLRRIWSTTPPTPPPPTPGSMSSVPPPPAPPGPRRRGVLATLRASGPRTRRGLVLAAATGMGVVVGGAAFSLYLGVDSVTANSFATRPCFDARLGSVQTGTHTNDTNGVSVVPITAVDPASSFVLFSLSSSSNEPDETLVTGRLATSNTLEFERLTDDGTPGDVVVEWSVVEYDCGISVQRGTASSGGASSVDVALSSIDTSRSFPLVSHAGPAGGSVLDADDLISAELPNATTLRLEAAGSIQASVPIDWQVVTFDDGQAVVQQLSAAFGPSDTAVNVSIPTSVDPQSTALFVTVRSAATGGDVGDRLVRARLVDADTVELSRSVGDGAIDVVINVIEFADGTTVRHGLLDLSASEATGTAIIPPVQVSRSTITSTMGSPTGLGGGSTTEVSSGVAGEASGRFVLDDERTVRVTRDSTAAAASFPYQVISWNGPSWADLDAPFRSRIDIEGGSVVTPTGYTTSLTFDHAQFVADRLSLPDGSDLRVWRHNGTAWSELHRVLDDESSWAANDTTVWFRTQEAIAASDTVSYWLYFGDEAPDPALADSSQVWLVTEGFDDGTLGAFEDRTGGSAWYDDVPWANRIVVDIDGSGLSGPVTDHPVLVRVTDPSLGLTLLPDASDARFTASDGTTVLPHQIEEWNVGTDTLTAWVRVPSVGTGTTTIHLYSGATTAADQADARSTWAGRLATWLLATDPTADRPGLDDDSPAQRDGVALAGVSAAVTPTGPGMSFDGVLDRLESQPFSVDDDPFTVSVWFNANSVGTSPVLATQGDPTTSGVWDLRARSSNDVEARLSVGGSVYSVSGGSISTGTWHHAAFSWDGSTLRLFVDGSEVASTGTSGALAQPGDVAVTIGADPGGSYAINGTIGHLAIDGSSWSADRALLDYGLLAGSRSSIATVTSGTWFEQGSWGSRWPLVVDSDSVAGTLVDYPLLVRFTDASLGAAARVDAADLVVTAADGVTRLDHWIEDWDQSTGDLTAWVRVPTLDGTSDTTLYLYAANATADDHQDPAAVWGPDVDLVITGAS